MSPQAISTQAGAKGEASVLRIESVAWQALADLASRFGLALEGVQDRAPIPGSYWGAPEAGLVRYVVFVRADTPVHSLLHELCHSACMDAGRRADLDTEAGGCDDEENAVCYFQVLLADHLQGVGQDRLMADMDAWGYSFRLGSTRAWFEGDASDARAWLEEEGLINHAEQPTWRLRR